MPKGTIVAMSTALSNKDPDCFPEPERFDPDRFAPPREEDAKHPWAYVPFGGGRHRCLGANFALMQQKAIFSVLLRQFEFGARGRARELRGQLLGHGRAPAAAVPRALPTAHEPGDIPMKLPGIEGKVAIVTGSGGGIGEAYAQGLAAQGAKVVVAEIDKAKGEAVAARAPQGRCEARSSSRWTSPRPSRRGRWPRAPWRSSAASTSSSTTPPSSAP